MKATCMICGHKTLESRCDWDICPVCFWEDDVILEGVDKVSPANMDLRVSESQANYMVFRSSSKQHVSSVRKPMPDEELDPTWQPLTEAISLANKMRASSHS